MTKQNTLNGKIAEQIRENILVLDNFNKALTDLQDYTRTYVVPFERLRTSSAYVLETDKYYLLRSYNTIVAVIDKSTNICYDALRHVYGFTRTSAQHIAKFTSDYSSNYPFRCTRYTYYNV